MSTTSSVLTKPRPGAIHRLSCNRRGRCRSPSWSAEPSFRSWCSNPSTTRRRSASKAGRCYFGKFPALIISPFSTRWRKATARSSAFCANCGRLPGYSAKASITKMATRSRGFDHQYRLTGFHRRLVVDEKARDLAGSIGMHFGELLHHLDEPDDLAVCDVLTVFLKWRLFRCRPAIKNSGQRAQNFMLRHSRIPSERLLG